MAEQDGVRERYGERVLSGTWTQERQRLAAMAQVCDPVTVTTLQRLGVTAGWRCLELGGGGGSIAEWLALRVGGTGAGHVLATDVDVRFLDELDVPHLTVLRHDVVTDPLPAASFDLIHARFLLEHLPEREQVLDRIAGWLAPGGVLLVESIASFPVASAPQPEFRAAMQAVTAVLAATIGTDAHWARGFPEPLRRAGLTEVGASMQLPPTGAGNASARCWALTLAQLRPRILDLGLATPDILDRVDALLADEQFLGFGFATALGWGRRHD
jgi:2-polyprenyl-3-methyl-5-hydroxy-6-metoxy-1,4-benzoquinol methylase